MRISTSQIYAQGVATMQQQTTNLQNLQQQLSTGKRILTAADDPVAAANALEVTQSISMTQQYTTNVGSATSTLSQEDSILSQVNNALMNARDVVVQAGSGSLTDAQRANLANTVQSYYNQILGLANSTDSNGQYIFAGNKGGTTPFAETSLGNVTYNGDQGQQKIQISASRQITVSSSGAQVFQLIRSGNGTFATGANSGNTGTGVISAGSVQNQAQWSGSSQNYQVKFTSPTTYDVIDNSTATTIQSGATYTSGGTININGAQFTITGTPATGDVFTVQASKTNQDIFSTLGALVTALNTSASTPAGAAALQNSLASALSNIDQASANVMGVRSSVGTAMNEVTAQQNTLGTLSTQYQTTLSGLQDVDYAQAISNFSMAQTTLTAAQKSFMQVQGLSLFNYIN